MNNPKVSIIIPNYNHARFLAKRIQSVLNQVYQDFEIIYLDDASTDNSNEVFSQVGDDKRIRAYFNETNSGSPFRQWNKGVDLARGEYIWIAESDDFADKRFLEELVPQLDMYPDVGLAFCKSGKVDEQDNIVACWEAWVANGNSERWTQDFVVNGKEECRRHLTTGTTIPNASAVLLRRNVYEKAGCADETMKIAGDWLMWVKMLMISELAFVAKPLSYFRTHPNTSRKKTFTNGIRIEEDYKVIRYILDNLDVSPEVADQVRDKMATRWVNTMVSMRGWIPWKRNRRIYRIARDIDPHLPMRLIKNICFRPMRAATRRIFKTDTMTKAYNEQYYGFAK